MTHRLTAAWKWRTSAFATPLIALLMFGALAAFYQPFFLAEALLDLPAASAFGLNIALPLLLLFGILTLLRPDLALGCVILTTPLTYRARGFFDGAAPLINNKFFPLHELILLLVLGATAVYGIGTLLIRGLQPRRDESDQSPIASGFQRHKVELKSLILPALWLLAGTIAALIATPEGRGAAWREWRWVIVEPLLLYGLVLFWTGKKAPASHQHTPAPAGPLEQIASANPEPLTLSVHRNPLIWGLLLAGVGASIVGLLQLQGIDWAPIQGVSSCYSDVLVDTGNAVRTSSVYCHPNNLALFLGRVWPVALVLLLGTVFGFYHGAGWRWLALATLYAACLGITLQGMLETYSKGARYAGVIVIIGLSLLPRRAWLTALTTLVLGGALAYSSFSGPERLNIMGDSSNARLSIWRSASAMLRDHPLTGIGLDQFFVYFNPTFGRNYIEPALADDEAERNTSHPHNLVLDLLLRVGPFGTFIFGCLIWRTARRGLRVWRSASSDRWLALAILAGGAVGLGHGLVDQGYFSPDLAIVTWLFIGLIDRHWLDLDQSTAM